MRSKQLCNRLEITKPPVVPRFAFTPLVPPFESDFWPAQRWLSWRTIRRQKHAHTQYGAPKFPVRSVGRKPYSKCPKLVVDWTCAWMRSQVTKVFLYNPACSWCLRPWMIFPKLFNVCLQAHVSPIIIGALGISSSLSMALRHQAKHARSCFLRMSLVSLCGHLLRTTRGTYGSMFLHKIIDYEALFFN